MADPTPRTIYRGENHIYTRKFTQRDGTDIDFDDVTSFTMELIDEAGGIEGTYTYTPPSTFSDGLRHLGDCEFEFEITKAVSAGLTLGVIKAKYTIEVDNTSYPVDGNQKDITSEHILTVIS